MRSSAASDSIIITAAVTVGSGSINAAAIISTIPTHASSAADAAAAAGASTFAIIMKAIPHFQWLLSHTG